ncbi:MAG: helix-turn-helix domain-containing protein [Thermoplasmata archaeon]|jgi:predicted transcriptional regulator|nr:helix-turn-helix domain-containing protein [Thermoplasmata archaeon]MBR4244097.1 helix-turn-helix domain-containing protein [Candidatus Methanomethylophilaceae archaeon]MBR6214743.1 helix-turn-helix domain-containing protein [Candidatus Methanomethylophilaceae archaeon]
MTVDDLITGMLREEGGFQIAFRGILDNELHMSLNEFCRATGISQSTLYKVMEGGREPNLRTVREVIKALKILNTAEENRFIAIIAASTALESIPESVTVSGQSIKVHEYPVATLEDAIIAAVRAERDGALGLVCAPIVAPTVEKILSIPVSRVIPTSSIQTAMERLINNL